MARNALEKVHFERNSGTLVGFMGSRPFAHKRSPEAKTNAPRVTAEQVAAFSSSGCWHP